MQQIPIPIRLIIVQAQAGAKGEFLAGWLGSLPSFVESHWTIDCETGQTLTKANFFKAFNHNHCLNTFLFDMNFCLSDQNLWSLVGTTHLSQLSSLLSVEQQKNIDIVSVKIKKSNLLDIAWNSFVKNNFTRHRYEHAIDQHITYGVDHHINNRVNINDSIRKDYIQEYIDKHILMFKPIDTDATHVFDYDELFVPGGSKLVATRLNLDCLDQHHKLWDKNLEFSHAPLSIERFGVTYNFDDFKRKFQSQIDRLP